MKRLLNRLMVTNLEQSDTDTADTDSSSGDTVDGTDASTPVEWTDISTRTVGPIGTEDRATDPEATANDELHRPWLLEAVLDGLADPTLVVDDSAEIIHLNAAACEQFETTEADALGAEPHQLHGGKPLVETVLETGEALDDYRERLDMANGQPLCRRVIPLVDETGTVAAAMETISAEEPTAQKSTDTTKQAVDNNTTQHAVDENASTQELAAAEQELAAAEDAAEAKVDELEAYQQTVIDDLEDKIIRLAEGDLTIEPTVPEPPTDFEEMQTIHAEFSDLSGHLTTAVENYRGVLSRLTLLADDLDDTSQELSANSEEVTASIEEISHSTEEMADGSQELAEQTDEADLAAANLTATIEEITASVQEIDAETSEASKLALTGVEEGTEAIEQIRSATDATAEITDEVRRLESRMEDVGETLDVISSIADQTNLLALNAAIEAARAGQEGDGFAVVAEEVKKLAEESKQSADEIEEIITDAQAQTDEVASQITHTNEEVAAGADAVEGVVESVTEIESTVEAVSAATAEVSDAVENQAENMDGFGATIDSAASMSEELSASVQQISAGLEQQTTATDRVAHRATSLSATSEELYDRIDQFRLAKDETAEVDDIDQD